MIRALAQCRVNVTRAVEDIDDFGNVVKECAALVRATDGDRFCTIFFYEPDKKNLSESKIWTHCSCPYYTFHVEVVNALKKSSDVINSNGELPVVRNPRMLPHLCKHLIALGKIAIVAKYKVVGRLDKEQKEAKKYFDEKERREKQGTKVPPSRVLKRPGEQTRQPGLKRNEPIKPGPKTPTKPGVKSIQRPKSVQGPKSLRRPGQR